MNGKQERSEKHRFLFTGAMFGGNTTVLGSLQEVISKMNGIESTWLPLDWEPKEFIARLPLISRNWTLKGGLVIRSRVRALERQGYLFDAALFNHQVPAAFLGDFRRRVPSVIWMDATPKNVDVYGKWYGVSSSSGDSLIERLKYRFTLGIYKGTAHLITYSQWVKDSLINDYRMPENKVTVVPPGVNIAAWEAPNRSGAPYQKRNGGLRILFIGSDFPRKGGDLLLKVARRPEFRDCEFHLLTYDPLPEVSENIVVHRGIDPNTDALRNLYRDSDIFVLPSRGDLSPIALLEAMTMELPVVATNVGAITEIVADGETGHLIPPDDENALADRLLRLVRNPESRLQFGRKGRARVEMKFNLGKNIGIILDIMIKAQKDRKA